MTPFFSKREPYKRGETRSLELLQNAIFCSGGGVAPLDQLHQGKKAFVIEHHILIPGVSPAYLALHAVRHGDVLEKQASVPSAGVG